MRSACHALALCATLILASSPAPAQSPMCDAVKQVLAVEDLVTLADGPLVLFHTIPLAGMALKRASSRTIVPQTRDCKVHRTDYAHGGHHLSYSCEIADADPQGRDHRKIVRDLNARLRPCLPGWTG